jgi:hypothetical protein
MLKIDRKILIVSQESDGWMWGRFPKLKWCGSTQTRKTLNLKSERSHFMKSSVERKILRWVHIILSIPIVSYLYEPVTDQPNAAFATTKFVFVPIVILSGLWMWKGQVVRKWLQSLR